jgi:hypothetical protein
MSETKTLLILKFQINNESFQEIQITGTKQMQQVLENFFERYQIDDLFLKERIYQRVFATLSSNYPDLYKNKEKKTDSLLMKNISTLKMKKYDLKDLKKLHLSKNSHHKISFNKVTSKNVYKKKFNVYKENNEEINKKKGKNTKIIQDVKSVSFRDSEQTINNSVHKKNLQKLKKQKSQDYFDSNLEKKDDYKKTLAIGPNFRSSNKYVGDIYSKSKSFIDSFNKKKLHFKSFKNEKNNLLRSFNQTAQVESKVERKSYASHIYKKNISQKSSFNHSTSVFEPVERNIYNKRKMNRDDYFIEFDDYKLMELFKLLDLKQIGRVGALNLNLVDITSDDLKFLSNILIEIYKTPEELYNYDGFKRLCENYL